MSKLDALKTDIYVTIHGSTLQLEIKAVSMTENEYDNFRGWQSLNKNGEGNIEGYMTISPALDSTDVILGWLDKSTFERIYKPRCKVEAVEVTNPSVLETKEQVESSVSESSYGKGRTFGAGSAIKYLEEGRKVCRTGWASKGVHLYLVPAKGDESAYIALRTADGSTIPWTTTQADNLATDWMIAPAGARIESEGDKKEVKLEDPRHRRFIDKHISENSCYKTDGEALVNKMLDTIIADSSYDPNFNLMGALLLAEQKGVSSICKFNGTEITISPELVKSSRWRIIEPTKPRTVVKKDIDMMINHSQIEYVHTGDKLTSCIVTLPTGFIITGESLCADKNNFNKELGEKYSLEKAIDKVWEHENYAAALEFYNSKK